MSFRSASRFVILLLFISIIGGCAKNKQLQNQAQKHFERGDFSAATYLSVESLKLKPDFADAQRTLKSAYPLAKQGHIDSIAQLHTRSDEMKWEQIVDEYLALKELNDAVLSLPQLKDPDTRQIVRFDIYDYSSQLDTASNNAAEYYYNTGVDLGRRSSAREMQKNAAQAFKKAMNFVAGYKDSAERYDIARQKATLRIAVMPFEDRSGSRGRYGAIEEMLVDQIISRILQDSSNMEFLDIISRSRIDLLLEEQQLSSSGLVDESSAARIGVLLGAQKLLSGRILHLDYNAPRLSSINESESSNIEVEQGPGLLSEEKEIRCEIETFTLSASLQILASYSLVDVSTGRIEVQESFRSGQSFEESWAKLVSGDSRALKPAQRALLTKGEAHAPSAREMTLQSIEDIARDIADHMLEQVR